MKKLLFVFLAQLVFCQFSFAKIWRVNNNAGVSADFTTAQAAHNGAAAGDTIHLEPSVTNYGDVTCTKKLVWLSTGNFLTQNPGKQYSGTPGTLSYMYFQSGSEGSVASIVASGYLYVYVSDISVIRSYSAGVHCQTGTLSNLLVSQSFFQGYISLNGNNVIVSNNIAHYVTTTSSISGAVIVNNVFTQASGSAPIYNAVFQNNISKGISFTFNNSAVSYNMHSGTGIPAGNNNQLNVNMAEVFENNNPISDSDFRLKAGSPATGVGFGGTDMGAFGGSTPYIIALQPAIPAITNLSAPSSAVNNQIQVTFSAKSNN